VPNYQIQRNNDQHEECNHKKGVSCQSRKPELVFWRLYGTPRNLEPSNASLPLNYTAATDLGADVAGINDLDHPAIPLFQDIPRYRDLSLSETRPVEINTHYVSACLADRGFKDWNSRFRNNGDRLKYCCSPDCLAPPVPYGHLDAVTS